MDGFFASAAPGIISGMVLLIMGGIFGAAGKVIMTAVRKGRDVAHEHTDLVCHLEESTELKDEVKEIKALQEKQNAVLRELIGRELDREHERLVKKGYATTDEKKAYERMYIPYHGINGNGARTSHFDDVMTLHAYET